MRDEELEEIEKRAAAATPGPWCLPGFGIVRAPDGGGVPVTRENTTFIAAARSDVPALCAALRQEKGDAMAARQRVDAREHRIAELERQVAALERGQTLLQDALRVYGRPGTP